MAEGRLPIPDDPWASAAELAKEVALSGSAMQKIFYREFERGSGASPYAGFWPPRHRYIPHDLPSSGHAQPPPGVVAQPLMGQLAAALVADGAGFGELKTSTS